MRCEQPARTLSGVSSLRFARQILFSCAVALPGLAAAQVVSEFPITTAASGPFGITTGPDGKLWFTERDVNKIGRITTAGVVDAEFPIKTAASGARLIAVGPDGNLWFTEQDANKIGQITTSGVVTEFDVPTAASGPGGIVAGPDGNLWFTEIAANQIGKITTGGAITEFPITTASSGVRDITAGPDGKLWFCERDANKIGNITTAGVVTEFPIPSLTGSYPPSGITSGPDGNLWIAQYTYISRVTPAGVFTSFSPGAGAIRITSARNGNLAFSRGEGIGEMTTGGALTNVLTLNLNADYEGITTGPDGNLWFTETGANKVGFVAP